MLLKPRPQITQPADPSYRLIPLTQGQVAAVDATDYDWLIQWNWFASWDRCTKSFYAVRGSRIGGTYKNIKMHRAILGDPSNHVDHEDKDTLNNRRTNLRLASREQNGYNRDKLKNNKSGFKGVHMQHGKYVASIRISGKLRYLGTFRTGADASDAYRQAAIEVAGDFARW